MALTTPMSLLATPPRRIEFLIVTSDAVTRTTPCTSKPLYTPGSEIVQSPLLRVSTVPSGTPVFVGPGCAVVTAGVAVAVFVGIPHAWRPVTERVVGEPAVDSYANTPTAPARVIGAVLGSAADSCAVLGTAWPSSHTRADTFGRVVPATDPRRYSTWPADAFHGIVAVAKVTV